MTITSKLTRRTNAGLLVSSFFCFALVLLSGCNDVPHPEHITPPPASDNEATTGFPNDLSDLLRKVEEE